jgi:hypothetical protein
MGAREQEKIAGMGFNKVEAAARKSCCGKGDETKSKNR